MWSPAIPNPSQARISHCKQSVIRAYKALQTALQSRLALIAYWIKTYLVELHWCRSRKAESEHSY